MLYSDLGYFVAVAQCGSLTRAAEQLGITQPSISKAIGRVESEVGVSLFTRTGNRIQLNQFGEKYYRAVLQSIGTIESAIEEIKDRDGRTEGNVRIATTVAGLLDELFLAFHRQYPQHKLCQYLLPEEELLDSLRAGRLDFVCSTTPIFEPDIQWVPLMTDELYIMVSAGHPLYEAEQIPLLALKDSNIVINNSGLFSNDDIFEFCHQAGFQPRVIYAGGEAELVGELVESGAASFIPASAVARIQARKTQGNDSPHKGPPINYLCITQPQCRRSYGLAYRRDIYRSPAASAFFAIVMARFPDAGKEE
mgnify:CR=1 FL=1